MKNLFFPLSLASATLFLSSCAVDKESSALFLAKEMCSCRFLVEQSESQCRDAIRLGLAVGDVTINYEKKETIGTAEDGSHSAVFRFISKKEGCSLKGD